MKGGWFICFGVLILVGVGWCHSLEKRVLSRQTIFKYPSETSVKRANLGLVMSCQLDPRNCYDDYIKRFERPDPAMAVQREKTLMRNRLLMKLLAAKTKLEESGADRGSTARRNTDKRKRGLPRMISPNYGNSLRTDQHNIRRLTRSLQDKHEHLSGSGLDEMVLQLLAGGSGVDTSLP